MSTPDLAADAAPGATPETREKRAQDASPEGATLSAPAQEDLASCVFCAARFSLADLPRPACPVCRAEGFAVYFRLREALANDTDLAFTLDEDGKPRLTAKSIERLPDALRFRFSKEGDPEHSHEAVRLVYRSLPRPTTAAGAAILDDVAAVLDRYLVMPSPEARDAVVLWIVATHGQAAWEHASRLVVSSPQKRCGKTRLLEVLVRLAHNPLPTSNISAAALVRSILADDSTTLILDEADAIFKRRGGERSEKAEDLRGIINTGHTRGFHYRRYNASTGKVEDHPTFCMAALGGIGGDLPDTILDRAVHITMRRRAPSERVQDYRQREVKPVLSSLHGRIRVWVRGQLPELAAARPSLPVEDRAADVWEPLVAVADAAGGTWPARARRACLTLCGADANPDEAGLGERLLADLKEVWPSTPLGLPEEHATTAALIASLTSLEEAPWGDLRGKPLDARFLARLLRPYGVKPTSLRPRGSEGTVKGYKLADLEDPWGRYLPTPSGPTPEQPEHGNKAEVPEGKPPVPDGEKQPEQHPEQPPIEGNGGFRSGAPLVPPGGQRDRVWTRVWQALPGPAAHLGMTVEEAARFALADDVDLVRQLLEEALHRGDVTPLGAGFRRTR
jgi:hypothetical protein